MRSLEGVTVLHAVRAEDGSARESRLIDTLLDHFCSARPMALASDDLFSLAPQQIFRPQAQSPTIDWRMADLNQAFDEVLATLIEAFQQAQVSFWCCSEEDSEVTRLRWLEQVLKAALLDAIERQGLDEQEKSLLYALVKADSDAPPVQCLQLSLEKHGIEHHQASADLLVMAERDERSLVLWCKPCGTVRSFANLAEFACALRDELAGRHDFDKLSWAYQLVEDGAFRHQARQLLNAMLQDVGQVQLCSAHQANQLENLLDSLTEPSSALAGRTCINVVPTIPLPSWLTQASQCDRFQYHGALLELCSSQALAQGTTSLGDLDDLHQYAVRRLREQMRVDHPGKTVFDPDRLFIHISQQVQTASTGPWDLEPLKTITLTELAISRLQPSLDEVATAITSEEGPALEGWLNLDYIATLVDTVDLGGQYPAYLHARLNDPSGRDRRTRRNADEWRTGLLFSALHAKIVGHLGEHNWQALEDFCRGTLPTTRTVSVAPLAFFCTPGANRANRVHGMFVIQILQTSTWILYSPQLVDRSLREYSSQAALMESIRAAGDLQQCILAWLDDDARPIYDSGGFTRPHLHRHLSELADLLGPATQLGEAALQQMRVPVSLAFAPWPDNLDGPLLQAKAQTLLLLASRQSVSSARQRWAIAVQLAWVAFNTITLLLRGPAATVAWLVTALASAKDDLATLAQSSTEEQILAGADLLFNSAMLLAHVSTASMPEPAAAEPGRLERGDPAGSAATQEPPQARAWQQPAEQPLPTRSQVTGWSDNQRVGNLPPSLRDALGELRANVSLQGLAVQQQGRLRGLYQVDGRCYVKLQETAYEVEESWQSIRIIGPDSSEGEWSSQWGGMPDGYHIVGRERSKGPWLSRWNGEWRIDLRLAGGMPRTRKAVQKENLDDILTLHQARKRNDEALLRNESFLDRYLAMTKPFDDAARASRAALANYPDVARSELPDALQAQLRDLLAMAHEARPSLQILALTYEKQSGLLASQVDIFARMSEPRFARIDPKGTATYARSQWFEQLLDTDLHLLHRLLDLTDYDILRQQSRRLISLPFGDEQAQLYLAYRSNVEAAVAIHKRILTVSERLDSNLAQALSDSTIQFEDKQAKLQKIIAQRRYSALISRAQVLSDLTQLVVNRDQLTRDNFDELLRLQADLRNREFQEALLSHDGLAAANLPYTEQAEILGNALREYETSLGKANYLLSLTEPALNSASLTAYISELTALKSMAERGLSHALQASDSGVLMVAEPVTYRVRPGRRQLIRTTQGRALLAEQAEDGSRAVQSDPQTQQTVAQYQPRGEQWEQIAEPDAPRSSAYLRQVGTRLLAQKADKIALVSRFAQEPNSLADLMDWQIQDMADIARQLASGPAEGQALAARLNAAVGELQAEKRRLLTDAYFNTRHPDSKALRYLHQEDQIEIALTRARKRLKDNDYLDVYAIHRKQPRQKLWEAHFHYTSAQANPREFAKGHLKFWEQRALSRDERLERSHDPAERINIYRGDLRLEQIEGVIPFPPG
ncbi:hypothetical protein GQL56_06780 [Pseudomonas putida]|nr:hypothetical protein [Pseudomonas putida]